MASPQFADDEIPEGVMDGKNPVFTLKHAPDPPSSLQLYYNGIRQSQRRSYSLEGNKITLMNWERFPDELDSLRASYRYSA